jgi:hypothetical protein
MALALPKDDDAHDGVLPPSVDEETDSAFEVVVQPLPYEMAVEVLDCRLRTLSSLLLGGGLAGGTYMR